jgi:hypothetical protein
MLRVDLSEAVICPSCGTRVNIPAATWEMVR